MILTPSPSYYADDEDLYIRCSADFATLVPVDQLVIQGDDGQIVYGDQWTLRSPESNFLAAGVQAGQVIHLDSDDGSYGPNGAHFAVAVVLPNALTLQRVGMPWHGMPLPVTGPDSPVSFTIRTFAPQIDNAVYWLNRKFRIHEGSNFWGTEYLADHRQLRMATICKVMLDELTNATRTKAGDWADKRELARTDLATAIDGLSIWVIENGLPAEPKSRNRIRLVR